MVRVCGYLDSFSPLVFSQAQDANLLDPYVHTRLTQQLAKCLTNGTSVSLQADGPAARLPPPPSTTLALHSNSVLSQVYRLETSLSKVMVLIRKVQLYVM